MATAQTVIKNFMAVLDETDKDSTTALSEAVQAVSKFASWAELTTTMVNDCAAYKGDYDAFLREQCNIILDNSDTGAITGYDAGGGSIKTAESIVPESGSIRYPTSNTFTIQGLNVTVPELSTLSDSERFIVGALYTWWINESLNLINNSFGMNFNESGTTVKDLDVTFYNSTDGRMAVVSYSTTQKCTELHLKINMHYYDDIDTSDPNGSSSSSALTTLDRTIAHEMTHAVMAANVDWYNNLPTVFKEGSAELVHGIDDKRYENIKNVASSSTLLRSALSGSTANSYAAGYMALRYLAKQAADGRDPADAITVNVTDTSTDTSTSTSTTTSTVSSGSATFSGNTLVVKGDFAEDIWLGDKDLITNKYSNYANVDATGIDATQLTNCIILAGNDNDNTIKSGRSGASIWGGANGNDLLVGGADRDMFWYSSGGGNDSIQSFSYGNDDTDDILTVTNGFNISRQGSNLALIMEDGGILSVTVHSDTNQTIQYSRDGKNILDVKVGNTDSGNTFYYDKESYFVGGNSNDTLTVNDSVGSARIFLSDEHFMNINAINAQNTTAQNILAGNHLDNEIFAGSANTSLWGGETSSNDTLTGGDGTNMFWYGLSEGNDIVNSAKSEDIVNLYNVKLEDIVSVEDFESGVKINMSSGSLTINTAETPKVMLSDGATYAYNRSLKSWTTA